MEEVVVMTSLALFLLLAALCSILFNKIKLPPLIGYLMAGIIVANFWHTSETGMTVVELLSDMGLIMLMFCIGMEINLKKIRKQGLFAIEVAMVQLPLMVLGGIIGGQFLGFNMIQSICLGAIISGSSTAVVMAVLKTQNHLDKEHIDTLVLITIMEDIGQVIILSIITPLMAGSELDAGSLAAMVLCIIAFMVVSIVAGLKLMPRIINWVSDNVSSEVLVIFAVGLAFGMALLASYVGLSVAIGAFLMGMMIAASRKSKEITHDIEPMKNIFMAMFFISVGMEIQLGTLVDNIALIIIIFLMFASLKTLTVFLGYWIGNESPRSGFVSAVSLAAMGEFAFIIAKQALDYHVVDDAFYTSVVGAALVSMIMLPILTRSSTKLWDKAAEKCPARIMKGFVRINNSRSEFYDKVRMSSKRTKKEMSNKAVRSYLYMVSIIVIEIVFFVAGPAIREWGIKEFGGPYILWSCLISLINCIILYIPVYKMVKNLKIMHDLTLRNVAHHNGEVIGTERQSRVFNNLLKTNNSILAAAISILILFVVPNTLSTWEHVIILIVALILLYLYNRKRLRNETPAVTHGQQDEEFDDMDLEKFRENIKRRTLASRGTVIERDPVIAGGAVKEDMPSDQEDRKADEVI